MDWTVMSPRRRESSLALQVRSGSECRKAMIFSLRRWGEALGRVRSSVVVSGYWLRSEGGRTSVVRGVIGVERSGRPSLRRSALRTVVDLTLRVLTRGRRAGSRESRDAASDLGGSSEAARGGCGEDELVASCLEGDGETGPVRIDVRTGLDGVDRGGAQELVEGEGGPHLLFDAGGVLRAQDAAVHQGVTQRVVRGLMFPAFVVEGDEGAGGVVPGGR
ncbi:hypothetical protein [Streptomyces sp. Inha503]|uniref:hypothetical protein n=1 Tax=Streptomyces sp. Inha503 TaxID=3383314 RepID=UPI0039A02525